MITALVASNVEKFQFPYKPCIEQALNLGPVWVNVDSGSADDTASLIRKTGAQVFENDWGTKSGINGKGVSWLTPQKQWIVDRSSCDSRFVLYLDIDEVISDEAIREISLLEKHDFHGFNAISFKFLHFYGNINYLKMGDTWYSNAVRLVRSENKYKFLGDGWAFGGVVNVEIYKSENSILHYGHVRKRAAWHMKNEHMLSRYNKEYKKLGIPWKDLIKFSDQHPQVILDNIELFETGD